MPSVAVHSLSLVDSSTWQNTEITQKIRRFKREPQNHLVYWLIWGGKSILANILEKQPVSEGKQVMSLDRDNIRRIGEVYVKTTLEEGEERDVNGIYWKVLSVIVAVVPHRKL